jgi:hypothetical protein
MRDHFTSMTGERPPEVLRSLPRARPHRRSQKRPARPADAAPAAARPGVADADAEKPARLRQPAQPAGTPPGPRTRRPAPSSGSDVLGTAVQAAAELAEMGLTVGARAIRGAVARLPRP